MTHLHRDPPRPGRPFFLAPSSRAAGTLAAIALAGLTVGCSGDATSDASDADAANMVDADTGPPAPASELDYPLGAPAIPRLTEEQYENAIHDLFGPDIVVPGNIEPDLDLAGLQQIGAAAATVSPRGVEKFEEASYVIAEQVVGDELRAAFDCTYDPTGPTDACAEPYLRDVAFRAWRRPVSDDEVATLVGIAHEAADTLDDFMAGIEFGLATILQSPNFLFRIELGEPVAGEPGVRRYTDYELASRLSFLLWNTIPDAELLDAAAAGVLSTEAGLLAQADRLLGDERARDGVRAFFEELYKLYELEHLNKDPTVFPQMSAQLGPDAREETLMTIEHLIFDLDGDVRELVASRRTFLNRRLAALYDVRAPAREGFAETELPATGVRRGLLGHAAILALNAHATTTSATLRGKFIREAFLCGVIPPPPSGVDTSIPEASETARTLRERVAVHLEDDFCAGCHSLMDPLGLALENFDGVGVYREIENGVDVDASGSLDGAAFADFDAFVDLIASDPRYTSCFVQKLNRYANSAVETPDQRDALEPLHDLFAHDGYRFSALLRHYIASPAFQLVGEIEE